MLSSNRGHGFSNVRTRQRFLTNTASRFPSTALNRLTTTVRCAPLPPSRGESPRPSDFSHRLRDEKSLVCFRAMSPGPTRVASCHFTRSKTRPKNSDTRNIMADEEFGPELEPKKNSDTGKPGHKSNATKAVSQCVAISAQAAWVCVHRTRSGCSCLRIVETNRRNASQLGPRLSSPVDSGRCKSSALPCTFASETEPRWGLTPDRLTDKVGSKWVFWLEFQPEQGRPARIARGFAAGLSSRSQEGSSCRSSSRISSMPASITVTAPAGGTPK